MYIDGKHNSTCESIIKTQLFNKNLNPNELRLCHQIDYATSGCLIYALNKKMAANVTKMFAK
jgi:23S rRNA-/tRNA-specific pseudouridylate synthase